MGYVTIHRCTPVLKPITQIKGGNVPPQSLSVLFLPTEIRKLFLFEF